MDQKKLRIWILFTQCDCTDYQDHLKNCFITDYVDYADINNTWKKISSQTTLPTLIWKVTIDNAFITGYVDTQE